MKKWEEVRRRPVLPLYLAALVWPVAALLLPVYTLWGLAVTAVLSLAVGLVAGRFCPTRLIRREVPFSTGSEDTDAMLTGITQNLDALAQLNRAIPDAELSRQLDRMEKAGRAIVDEIQHDPKKAPQVDRFARYYLPEAVKILAAYARMQTVQGDNAGQVRREVNETAGTIAQAFENQLDALYSAEALDISTDIEVLEGILKGQNLAR
ncbi:5-bromo-4-chloroindolyl phosphate hydrolysis family protein [Gemmiger formicilis]|uniref:5-bromo-4-chloroindolyl phosphate hydrolysis family protein n=1 Tax=Gemmiger formicilis TaxID=745368 RepID=UPI00195C2523|nr:5-bromo-4-chloroindolyl phosphate hydrolysis family protein [Gemmiger formicilis]MBM6717963.1 5-bromo-4-chloroindolyl phosphate hydrolysis family protein [Gemmiger formicilis]